MKLSKILLRKGYTKIKLKKINTNHFEFKARLNGIRGRFILDTGASNSCIDDGLIEKFNLQKVEDSETKAAGAGAIGMDTQTSSHNTLEVKNWSHRNFTIVILNLSHVNTALTEHDAKPVHGIIGADVLEKGEAIIDYKRKRLFLKRLTYKY
jgi:hypothetical protein